MLISLLVRGEIKKHEKVNVDEHLGWWRMAGSLNHMSYWGSHQLYREKCRKWLPFAEWLSLQFRITKHLIICWNNVSRCATAYVSQSPSENMIHQSHSCVAYGTNSIRKLYRAWKSLIWREKSESSIILEALVHFINLLHSSFLSNQISKFGLN